MPITAKKTGGFFEKLMLSLSQVWKLKINRLIILSLSTILLLMVIGLIIKAINTVTLDTQPPPPIPEAQPQPVSFPTTISATITGNLDVRGSARNGPYNGTKISNINEPSSLIDGRTGDESQTSCGNQWVRSVANSTAQITPRNIPQSHIYGFALSVSCYARGGFWRGYKLGACSGSHNECGYAEGRAVGYINLNYTAPTNIKDQLIIRVNGGPNAEIEVREVGGDNIPIQNKNSGKIVELPHSGAYTIKATLFEATGGQCGAAGEASSNVASNVEVTVQSLRDALNSYGTDELFQIPIPVFIPTDEIRNRLYQALFEPDGGKFYPCHGQPDCEKYARDIYLENPEISVNGTSLTLKMHLTGHGSIFILHPGITGDIYLSGTPIVENDTLFIKNLRLETESDNMITKYIDGKYGGKLVENIQKKAAISLKDKFDKLTADLKKEFPKKWGSACLLLDLEKIVLKQIYLKSTPNPGITADFGISLRIENEQFCSGK